MAYCTNHLHLYYWSDKKLWALRSLNVMPHWYYHGLYRTCLWLADFNQLKRIADRMIHTIPFSVRFKVA
jgi:hypothetical protein